MKPVKLKGGQKYIQVEERFSLIPIEKAVAEVSDACELLLHIRYLEPPEWRARAAAWIFGNLRQKYGESWLEVWGAYVESDHCEHLLERADEISKANFIRQIEGILEDSGFGEE